MGVSVEALRDAAAIWRRSAEEAHTDDERQDCLEFSYLYERSANQKDRPRSKESRETGGK